MASTESCESMDSLASPVHPSGAVDEMHPASRPSGVLTSFVRPNRPPADSSCVCRRYAPRLNHRHTDSQSGAGRPPALYFNKLPGRPLPSLQHNAGRCRASSRKIHAAHSSLVTVESDWKIGSNPRLLGGAPKAMSGRCSPYSLGNAACVANVLSNPA